MYKTDSKRIPGKDGTPDKSLIGKYVKITSNASHKNHKKIGRIIGFAKKGDYIEVFGERGIGGIYGEKNRKML